MVARHEEEAREKGLKRCSHRDYAQEQPTTTSHPRAFLKGGMRRAGEKHKSYR